MSDLVLEGPLDELREREIRLLHDAGDVLARIAPEGERERQRLRDVADDLRNMFYMVVVVGEFNAGKSSFINALLQDGLLPTGITPTTEVIELIRYGESPTRRPEVREDGVRVWLHPNVGGQGVVLVDTPGTGSVFVKHEETARNFLHRSDLVVFVLSAKHAFGETDRLYFELLRSYGKKVIVVVNQVDLLEPREQADVRRFVQTQIEQRLNLKPLLFMVSSRRALEGYADSGIDAVRAHLRATFEQVSPARQKLNAQLNFASQLLEDTRAALQARLDLIDQNREQTSQVQKELETYAESMSAQLRTNSEEIKRILDGVRSRGDAFIERNFKVRLGRNEARAAELQREFEDQVIGRSLEQIEDLANDYVNAQVDSSRRYWQGIVARLNKLDDLLQEEVRGVDGGVYSEQRVALQEAIAIADAEMSAYSNQEMLHVMQERFQANLTGLGSSAGLSVLGALAAALGIATPGVITAHALALLGAVVGIPIAIGGGVFAVRYWLRLRRDVKADFSGQIDLLERSYRQAMTELTDRERGRLLQYGRQILDPVFSRFAALVEAAEQDLEAVSELETRAAALQERLAALDNNAGQ
ncbi:MAG: dynamin family protein [Anaerolineae bacterium]|nr:dynamin family protein [Anaerolineae bacterium]